MLIASMIQRGNDRTVSETIAKFGNANNDYLGVGTSLCLSAVQNSFREPEAEIAIGSWLSRRSSYGCPKSLWRVVLPGILPVTEMYNG